MKVESKIKSARGKEYKCGCGGCGKVIQPGETYFSFTFFRQQTQYRCKDHRPRQSELTQTPMSRAYAAIEAVEDIIVKARARQAAISEIVDELNSAAEEIDGTKDDYQEQYDNLPENFQNGQQGDDINEKISSLETFYDTLQGAASDVEGMEPDEPLEGEDESDKEDEVLQQAADRAEEALQEFDQ